MLSKVYTLMSTGLPELDEVIHGVIPGDNIVWQVDSIEEYKIFVNPFCRDAYNNKKKLVYFRFAEHAPLIPEDVKAEVFKLNPENGFESFISEIFNVIEKYGEGTFYVFDSLSELAVDWYSDRMLANFFMLTCPYLYDFDTVTYFALLRNRHTAHTINAIQDTAQVIIDIYIKNEEIYIHPLKIYKRFSNTIYMLHRWNNNKFDVVTKSTVISEILRDIQHPWLDFSINQQDLWNRIFAKAKEIQKRIDNGEKKDAKYEEYRQRILRMVVTREERLLALAEKHFDLSDLIDIGSHMIGTGLVGGKTVGMLLARAILKNKDDYWKNKLEPHDSFFIGSDVFYTYQIKSKCWWVRWKQRKSENFLEGIEEGYQRLLTGKFPEDIIDQFREILKYFGQSPIIVRSSSLLEDAYGNSFSGKYESVFCTNQGDPEERLEEFLNAVRYVYASTMNREALIYRSQRGLLDIDKQMSLLVQRVSGEIYNNYYFPQIAGTGFSYNLYVWDKSIDPQAGVLRIVFGLGTRAVNRSDDDYTRIVAVNDPGKRPEANFGELKKFAQKKVDILNLKSNNLTGDYFSDIMKNITEFPLDLFASRDSELEEFARQRNMKNVFPWILTFNKLFSDTDLIKDLGEILKILKEAYNHPVDIEYTANFSDTNDFKINLLQCRPYQIKKGIFSVKEPGKIKEENVILKTKGPIIGSSIHSCVDRLIFVVPAVYGVLPEQDRYSVARLIGNITNLSSKSSKTLMLLGPGRWGTTTPSLGVPVQFGEINNVSILCEIAEMHEGLVPDVSLGTHFFNDIVELDILYMAIYPEKSEYYINRDFLKNKENQLLKLIPEASKWKDVVKVIDFFRSDNEKTMYLNANAIDQRGICYLEKKTRTDCK